MGEEEGESAGAAGEGGAGAAEGVGAGAAEGAGAEAEVLGGAGERFVGEGGSVGAGAASLRGMGASGGAANADPALDRSAACNSEMTRPGLIGLIIVVGRERGREQWRRDRRFDRAGRGALPYS
jgi:hypothetical protein